MTPASPPSLSDSSSPPGALLSGLKTRQALSWFGPAFVASIAYIDPGNFGTNLIAGTGFGYKLLWVLLWSNLMAILIQYLSAKLGIATGATLPQNCREHFSRPTAIMLWVAAELSALATDLAEFLGAALGFYLLCGGYFLHLGLAQTTGEYVWFVDPDDLLTAGSLEAVSQALAASRPDVLLIDYRSLLASGRTQPSPGGSLRGYQGTGTLAQWPALINRTMTSWSKVIRRDFLDQLGVPFPAGIHEDVPVSCAVLLNAGRIAVLDWVCYLYRRRKRSFLATRSAAHFAIFSSYAQVFAAMEEKGRAAGLPPIDAAVRAAVFGRAIEHYSTVLSSGLVPARRRREYFHRMAADFRRYRPPGYSAPPGARGMKFRLVEQDAWCRYALLEPLNTARVAARRALRSRRASPQESPMPAVVSREPG